MATFARSRLPDQGAGGVPVNLLGGASWRGQAGESGRTLGVES